MEGYDTKVAVKSNQEENSTDDGVEEVNRINKDKDTNTATTITKSSKKKKPPTEIVQEEDGQG